MNALHYIGFDVHKKTISFCVKTAAGEIVEEGSLLAQRGALREWASVRPQPWRGAMEATLFSGWIYDTLKPYGEQLEMAHPAKMKAISAGKKKSDTIDARTIADLVRCNLLPACYVAAPRIRELRRLLRYRSLVVSEAVRMKNKMAGLLMETGALYVKEKLHRKKYFASLLEDLAEVPESVIVDHIHASKTRFTLSTDEIIRLTKAGAKPTLIDVMRNPGAPAKPDSPPPPATPAPERRPK